MAAGRIHNFAFFLLTFYFPNWPINQFEAIMQNKPNFRKTKMNLNSYLTTDYENERLADTGKTNPIQTQYKAKTNPIPKRPKMNENLFATKVYENITTFRPQKNKANTNPTCRGVASGEAGSNPTCSELACPELADGPL